MQSSWRHPSRRGRNDARIWPRTAGTAGTAVTPADPKQAEEADKADPGAVETIKAEQRRTKTGKYGSVRTRPGKAAEDDDGKKKKKTWIEIELVDKKKKPIPGEPYRITLADGQTICEGTLDEKGFARVEGIDPGTCKITFPRLDKGAWKQA